MHAISTPSIVTFSESAWAHLKVGASLSDFTGAIRHHAGRDGLFTTRECARRHAEDRAFIEGELKKTEGSGLTPVVITHHAPNLRCIRPWFEGSRLNPGFASEVHPPLVRGQPTEPRVRFGPAFGDCAVATAVMGARAHA